MKKDFQKQSGEHNTLLTVMGTATHGLGPVSTMLDINRGNRMLYLTSTATQSKDLRNISLIREE